MLLQSTRLGLLASCFFASLLGILLLILTFVTFAAHQGSASATAPRSAALAKPFAASEARTTPKGSDCIYHLQALPPTTYAFTLMASTSFICSLETSAILQNAITEVCAGKAVLGNLNCELVEFTDQVKRLRYHFLMEMERGGCEEGAIMGVMQREIGFESQCRKV